MKIKSKTSKFLATLLSLLMVIGMVPMGMTTAFADEKVPVEYIDVIGAKQTVTDYKVIDSSTTELTAGWWVVKGNVNISGGLTQSASSDVKIILTDGCMLNSSDAYTGNSGAMITFYGQKEGTGTFAVCGAEIVDADKVPKKGMSILNLTVNGGNVIITGGASKMGGPGLTCTDLTVNDGTLSVTGGRASDGPGGRAIGTKNFVLNGGTVTATGANGSGGRGGYGISVSGIMNVNGGNLSAAGGCKPISDAEAMQGDSPQYTDALSVPVKAVINVAKSVIVKVGTTNPPATVITHEDTTNLTSSFSGQPFVTMTEKVATVKTPVKLVDNGTVTAEAQGIVELDMDPYYADKTRTYFTDNFTLNLDGSNHVVFKRESGYLRYYADEDYSYIFGGFKTMGNLGYTIYACGKVVRALEQPSAENGYKFIIGYDKDNVINGTVSKIYKETQVPAAKSEYADYGDQIVSRSRLTLTLITRENTPRTFTIAPGKVLMLGNSGLIGVNYDIYKTGYASVDKIEGEGNYYYEYTATLPLSGDTVKVKSDLFSIVHTHTWSYTANGNTLTATCSATDCTVKTQSIKIVPSTCNYDGQAHGVTFDGSVDGVALTDVKFYDGTKELSGAPVKAGTYTAKLTKGTATAETTVVISQKLLTVAGTTVSDKTYDGTTTADVDPGSLQGVVLGDDVKLDTVTGTFEDKNASDDKEVTVVYTLKGDDASNYTIENETIEACINLKAVEAELTATEITSNSLKASLSITDFDKPEFENAVIEYAITITVNEPDTWQSSNAFTGLTSNTTYYIHAKVTGVENYNTPKIFTSETKTAIYVPEYDITYSICKNGSISGVSKAKKGAVVTVTATPDVDYRLDSIIINGSAIKGTSFTMGAAPITVFASFTLTDKALYREYVKELIEELKTKLDEDINNTIADAIDNLGDFGYQNKKSLDENKAAAKAIADAAVTKLQSLKDKNELNEYKLSSTTELDAEGEDLDGILAKAKEDIADVEINDNTNLDDAKKDVDKIVSKAKEDLLSARKTAFEEYKQEKIEEIENSDASELTKTKKKEKVSAVEYDETKSLEENESEVDSCLKDTNSKSSIIIFLISLVIFVVGFVTVFILANA